MGNHQKSLDEVASHKKGCVTKHEGSFKKNDRCSYRWNGYEECKTAAKKDHWEIDFTQPANGRRLPYLYKTLKIGHSKDDPNSYRFADNPLVDREAWWFTKEHNFVTAYLPYNHNYHHILPWDSLNTELKYEQLKLLQGTGYNLNGRENMIILPCLDAYGTALKLPAHPYAHAKYNEAVANKIQKIKDSIKIETGEHEISKNNIDALKQDLETWEKRQFKKICEYGEQLASENEPGETDEPNQINNCPMARRP